MARPITIESATLLEAARAVFLERGVHSTTAEIAQRARVSEGTLFKRFGSKVQLFHAVLTELIEDPSWLDPLREPPAHPSDLERRLVELVARGCARVRTFMPLVMMAWSSARDGWLPPLFERGEPPQVAEVGELAGVLDRAMRRGLLARRDPRAAAQLLLGAMQNFAIVTLGEPAGDALSDREREHARKTVSVLLDGLRKERP
jgi:AcrR family transcriptional regulator